MSRGQLVLASSVLGAAIAAVVFTVVKKGNDFSVTAKLSTGGAEPVVMDVADDSGKIRVFKDVDDFVKAAVKLSLITSLSNVAFTFANLAALEPTVFTGDIVKRTVTTITNYGKQVTALGTTIAGLNAALALLPAVTPGEIAYKAEKTLQKTTVEANKAYLEAEIIRLTALLPAP